MRTFEQWVAEIKSDNLTNSQIEMMRAAWNAALYGCEFRGWAKESADGQVAFTTSPTERRLMEHKGGGVFQVYQLAPLSLKDHGI